MLSVDGEFYPFAVALTLGGELVSPAVDPGTEQPARRRGRCSAR